MDDADIIESDLLNNIECASYDFHSIDLNNFITSSRFNLIHQNIRSARNKNLDELILTLDSMKTNFQILMLTETWLDDTTISCINLPNFYGYHSTRTDKKGGGVSIFLHNKFNAIPIPSMNINNSTIECVGVKVNYCNKNYNFICVYRPPRSSLDAFNNTISELLGELPRNDINFIAGDFNINMLDTDPSNQILAFKESFSCNFYLPLINLPTRVTGNTDTCIDLIFTNSLHPIESGTLKTNISDHRAVFSTVPINDISINEKFEIKFRNHSDENISKFRNDLIKNLEHFPDYDRLPIDDRLSIFMHILLKIYDQNFPILFKKLPYKRLFSPWISDSLKRCIDHKHKLYKCSRNNPSIFNQYKRYNNMLKCIIKSCKTNYYQKKFDLSSKNTKDTWKTINSLIKPKVGKNPILLQINDSITSDPDLVSEHFNNHFISLAPALSSCIPPTDTDPLSYLTRNPRSFVFFETNYIEVSKIISNLKSKKCSVTEIPIRIYKKNI